MNLIGSVFTTLQSQSSLANTSSSTPAATERTNAVAPAGESGRASNDGSGTSGSGNRPGDPAATDRASNPGSRSQRPLSADDGTSPESVNGTRENSSSKPFQIERSIIDRLLEIDPGTRISDIVSRMAASESDEAAINSRRFIERLSEVRGANAVSETVNDTATPDTTTSGTDPVGRYDKSA